MSDPPDTLRLSVLPPRLLQLRHLRVLCMSGHRLSSLSPIISAQFPVLESLDVSRNLLTTIPTDIVLLTRLESLSVAKNSITSLPWELSKLPLKLLDVSGNRIDTCPQDIIRMQTLLVCVYVCVCTVMLRCYVLVLFALFLLVTFRFI